jgi:DNA-binding NarL/FixJ family response regulator
MGAAFGVKAMTNVKILLADDHPIVVEGLRTLLAREFELVGVVADGRAMVAETLRLQPDLIVADVAMPRLNGIEAFEQIHRELPRVKAIFLTMHEEIAYARRALEAGASGFVLKHAAPSELITAIRAALNGETYIAPSLASEILCAMRSGQRGGDPDCTLTPRQREILQLVAEGRSAKEIAAELAISTRTVEFHKYQMMETLGLHNSPELIRYALRNHLITV